MEKRRPILVKLPPHLVDEIDAYCARQTAKPTRTAVIEAALADFVEANKLREAKR